MEEHYSTDGNILKCRVSLNNSVPAWLGNFSVR